MTRDGITLDGTDRAIIEALQIDGRQPYTRLGASVGLSEAATRQRVQRLIESDAIQVVAVTNPLKLGRRRVAMIGIRASGPTEAITAKLKAMDEIDYLVVTAGSVDILAEVVVSSDVHLLELTNRIRSVDGVVATESFVYLDLVKQTYQWGAH